MAVRRVWRRLTLLAAIILISARNYSLIHPSLMRWYDRAPAAPMSSPIWPEQSPLLSPLGMGASNVSALTPQYASRRGFHTRRSSSTGTSRGGGQRSVNAGGGGGGGVVGGVGRGGGVGNVGRGGGVGNVGRGGGVGNVGRGGGGGGEGEAPLADESVRRRPASNTTHSPLRHPVGAAHRGATKRGPRAAAGREAGAAAARGVDQLKRIAWYEKHFPKLETQPGRFIPSSELHDKVLRLQRTDSSQSPLRESASPSLRSRMAESAVSKHTQWREKDRWWEAVMANEDFRSECAHIEAQYQGLGKQHAVDFSRMPTHMRARWSKLKCDMRQDHASSLNVED